MTTQANEIQCQAIKANRMQCSNPAFVTVNGIHYCRLDFNWLVAQQRDGLTFDNLEAQIFPINPEDQGEVDKIKNVEPIKNDNDNNNKNN